MSDPNRMHFIQRVKFDFEIEQKDDAHRLQNDLSRLFNQKLERLFDKLLSEADDSAYVTRIPKIEIDLGQIEDRAMEKEVLFRFETQFRKELRMRMSELRQFSTTVPVERGDRTMVAPAQIEILAYFLAQGRLPIGAEGMAGKLETLLSELIDSQPSNVLRMLSSVGRTSSAGLKRLATSFSDKLVQRIYQLVAQQHALSIATFETQVTTDVAKITRRTTEYIKAEVRVILLRYLLVNAPVVFDLPTLQVAVSEEVVRQFGEETAPAFKVKTATAPQDRPDDPQKVREKQEALELIASVVSGKARRESNLSVVAAWEFLISHDIPALKLLLATQATGPASFAELVAVIPAGALKDFLQRAVTGIGLRLIQVAATVVSAHALFNPTTGAQERVGQAIYAALLHVALADPDTAPTPQKALTAIKAHLGEIKSPPKQLLKAWDQFDFIEPTQGRKPDAPPANEPDAVKGNKPAKETATPVTEEQKAQAMLQAQKELEALAEQERNHPPMTPEERKAEETRIIRAREEIVKRLQNWDQVQAEALRQALAKNDANDADLDTATDEEFFERGREILRKAAAPSATWETMDELEDVEQGETLFLAPNLATAEGRIDAVMHYLATGSAPWWAKRFMPLQVELMVKNMVANEPEAIHAAFVRIAKSLPTDRYVLFVERLVNLLEEKTFMNLMPLLAGELGGFAVSVGLAVKESIAMLPEGVTVPHGNKEIRMFAFKHPLRYLMIYASSSPSPSQLVRYVLQELVPVVGLSPRKTIEWMAQVVEILIDKGERRFAPIKSMLPKVFEGIEVLPPDSHPVSADNVAFQRFLGDKKQVAGIGKEAEPTSDVEMSAPEVIATADVVSAQEKAQQEIEAQIALKDAQASPKIEAEASIAGNIEASIEGSIRENQPQDPAQLSSNVSPSIGDVEVISPQEDPSKPENKKPLETAHVEKTQNPILGDNPFSEITSPDEAIITPETPVSHPDKVGMEGEVADTVTPEMAALRAKAEERAAQSRALKQKLDAQFLAAQQPLKAEEPMELDPEEAAQFGIDEVWLLDVVRYYFVHGSLSPAATAMFTADTFKEAIKGVLETPSKAIVQMMRELIGNSNVRQRIYALGDELVFKTIALVNVAASDKMLPFVREMVELFKGSASPVSKNYIFEHAVRHAAELRTTFLPITYVKELFQYIAVQPNLKAAEAIAFASRKLESSNSPLRSSLNEMIDVVERIEELRQKRRDAGMPDEMRSPSAPVVSIPLDEEIYVENGGVGIIYLFLITLFKAFNFLTEDKKAFVSTEAQIRAIHQIQYCCFGEIDSPEERMVMAKLLVGWGINTPLDPLETPFGTEDIENCDVILGMVCTQWGVMKNAGIDYLRKTFIQRDARLKYEGKDWVLRVEQNGIDVLKNKIPWGTNPIRMPWNDFVIEVEWP